MASTLIPCNEGSTRRYKYRSTSSDEITILPKKASKSRGSSATTTTEIADQPSHTSLESVCQTNTEQSSSRESAEESVQEALRLWPSNAGHDAEPDNCLELRELSGISTNRKKEMELPTHAWYARQVRTYFLGRFRKNKTYGQVDVFRVQLCLCDPEGDDHTHSTECTYRQSTRPYAPQGRHLERLKRRMDVVGVIMLFLFVLFFGLLIGLEWSRHKDKK